MAQGSAIETGRMGTILASAVRTALSTVSADFDIVGYPSGLLLVLDVTDVGVAAPSLTVRMRMRDIPSNKTINILQHAGIVAVGTYIFAITPALAAYGGATATAQALLPARFSVQVSGANVDPITYSIGYSYI